MNQAANGSPLTTTTLSRPQREVEDNIDQSFQSKKAKQGKAK